MVSPWIWLAIFVAQPHKEERSVGAVGKPRVASRLAGSHSFSLCGLPRRFLFPIYPLLCLAAAVTVESMLAVVTKKGVSSPACDTRVPQHPTVKLLLTRPAPKRPQSVITTILRGLVVAIFVLLSLSRAAALYKGYHAPLDVYANLPRLEDRFPGRGPIRVCVGKEWYRYPGSFFLPNSRYACLGAYTACLSALWPANCCLVADTYPFAAHPPESYRFQLRFLKSEFRGQLPSLFAGVDGTSVIPEHMNDMNEEEESRYVDERSCRAIVDLDTPSTTALEPRYADGPEWERLFCTPFLDPANSHPLFRAFHIPVLGKGRVATHDYCLLVRRPSQTNSEA